MRRTFSLLLFSILIGIAPAHADMGVSVKIGTLGFGTDLTVGVLERLNLRFGYNTLSYDWSGQTDSEDLQADLDLETMSALVDWHVGGGAFRLTGGVFINNNEVTLTADVSQPVELNNTSYTLASVAGDITFDDTVIYLGIGTGNAVADDGNWHFAWDLGLLFQGEPQVDLRVSPTTLAILADVEAERKELEDDASIFDVYPVFSLGMSYRF